MNPEDQYAGQPYIGVYSQKAVEHGTSFYRTPDGREVEVTAIFRGATKENLRERYGWDDAVILGPVAEVIRLGKPSRWLHYTPTMPEFFRGPFTFEALPRHRYPRR